MASPPEFPAGLPLDRRLREALAGCCAEGEAYFVGGMVRDLLLGRPTADYDLVLAGDPRAAARCLADRLQASSFPLDRERGIWRVVGNGFQIDLERLAEGGLAADLARRDLTINAIALALEGNRLIDPHGGLADLRNGVLRAVGGGSFAADPLRVVRVARFACELGFAVEEQTAALARRAAPALAGVAPERILAELARIFSSPDPAGGFRILSRLEADRQILPELLAERGVEQNPYHHLDVYNHTLECLAYAAALRAALREGRSTELPGSGELEAFLAAIDDHRAALVEALSGRVAEGFDRFGALCFGALLHDVAKPLTKTAGPRGWPAFPAHDRLGARVAREVVARLRGSARLREHLGGLVAHHLRLGFLLHEEEPLAPRTRYAYLRRCEPVGLDVTLLSVADRLATRGRNHERAIADHLALAAALLPHALAYDREGPPPPPLRGDRLAQALGIEPGPLLGELLEELRAARYAGEVRDAAGAVAHARAVLARRERGA